MMMNWARPVVRTRWRPNLSQNSYKKNKKLKEKLKTHENLSEYLRIYKKVTSIYKKSQRIHKRNIRIYEERPSKHKKL